MNRLLAILVLAPGLALAADLKPAQEEAKADFEKRIEDPLKKTNDKCGTKLTVKTDFENLQGDPWKGTHPSTYCEAVLDAIQTMCESRPAYKKVIATKVTGVACLISDVKPAEKGDGSSGATPRNMWLTGGTFTFHMAKGMANIKDSAKLTLEKAFN